MYVYGYSFQMRNGGRPAGGETRYTGETEGSEREREKKKGNNTHSCVLCA